MFTIKVFRNDKDSTYVCRIGGEYPQQSNLMHICSDLNSMFYQLSLNLYASVVAVDC